MGRAEKSWARSAVRLGRSGDDSGHERVGGKGRKWWPWTRASGSRACRSSGSEGSSSAHGAASRVSLRDFRVSRDEWAAVRIQTAFRGLLARRARRALKAIVRLQALVRGRTVRKQAAVTLRCMEALVRVQALVQARQVCLLTEVRATQGLLNVQRSKVDALRDAEEGWCNTQGSLEEIRAKQQMRKDGTVRRERAITYLQTKRIPFRPYQDCENPMRDHDANVLHFSHWGSKDPSLSNNREAYTTCQGWSWLDGWTTAKPLESMPSKQGQDYVSELQPSSNYKHLSMIYPDTSEPCAVNIRKNNVTTRISSKPPCGRTHSRCQFCESPTSCSSIGTPVQMSRQSNQCQPSYMRPTHSIKAKQKNFSSYLTT